MDETRPKTPARLLSIPSKLPIAIAPVPKAIPARSSKPNRRFRHAAMGAVKNWG